MFAGQNRLMRLTPECRPGLARILRATFLNVGVVSKGMGVAWSDGDFGDIFGWAFRLRILAGWV